MIEKFYPQFRYNAVTDIESDFFKKNNIKNVVLDIDNTLVPYTSAKPSASALCFIERLKNEKLRVCLVSNNNKKRVTVFNEELNLTAMHRALKPLVGKLKRALKELDANPEETAIIGDQLFTDIYCGNRMNMITVLVEPIECKENTFFRLKRKLEKKIIYKMENKR